ncbi:MAG: putative lipid II flippase MurJ [Candidatus Tectimicrobiota bacterium]|nr:MAG: putative lipid II flippase MurJ [Candidatus Tectomicrobia bacterium]
MPDIPSGPPWPRLGLPAAGAFPSLWRRGLPIVTATLLSRPLGYLRAAVQAWLFGATAAMDAFVVAFSVPSILQVVLLSGPLGGVLVPILSAYRHDRQALQRLFRGLFTLCLLAGLALAGLAALAAPLLMRAAAPGLAAETHRLAVLLFRLMLPMLVVQALLSVCKGALNTLDHYGAPEYAGVVFNLVVIAAAVGLAPALGIVSLAVGVSAGALAQLLLQFPFLARYGLAYRPCLPFGLGLRRLRRLAQGAFLTTLLAPLGALVDRALASLLFPGAIAALNYAFLLFMLPASLCVVPLSTVLLTDLARTYHAGAFALLRQRARTGLRLVLLLTVPVAAAGVLLAGPLTRLVYEYGRFQASDTLHTAQALRAYLLGLPFYGCLHLLHRCFYALQDTMTPARVGLGAFGVNVLADLVFMRLFSHWGIALARSLTLLASALALFVLWQRRCPAGPPLDTARTKE